MQHVRTISRQQRNGETSKESQRVFRVLDLFEQATSAQQPTAEEAKTNRQLYHNIAYTQEQIDRITADGMPVTAAPILNAKVQQHTGLIAGSEPSFAAVGREDSDTDFAALSTDILSYVWQNELNKGQAQLIQVNRDDFIGGRGIFFTYIDPTADLGRGEVRITRLEPFEVYPDPRSKQPDWSDADFIFVSSLMTVEKAVRRWGEKKIRSHFAKDPKPTPEVTDMYAAVGRGYAYNNEVLYGDKDSSIWGQEQDQFRMLEEYRKVFVTRHVVREIPLTPNPAKRVFERVQTEAEYIAYRKEQVYQIIFPDGKVHFAVTPQDVAYWAGQYAAGIPLEDIDERAITFIRQDQQGIDVYRVRSRTRGQLIDANIISHRKTRLQRIKVTTLFGETLLHEFELPTGTYPICPMMSQHDGTPYPTSKTSLIRSLIDQYNKNQQLQIQWAAAIAGPKIYSEDDVILNPAAITSIGPDIVKLKRGSIAQGRIPFKMPMEELPSHFFTEKAELINTIDLTTGLYPQLTQGAPGPSREPFRSFQGRDEAQQRRIRIDDAYLDLALTSLARVVIDLFVSITHREKVLRIVQPSTPSSAPARTSTVNEFVYDDFGNVIDILYDIQALNVDIRFVAGSTFPVNKEAEREKYVQLYQLFGPPFAPHVLKKFDIPNWEKIVADIDTITQLQQENAQLQEQLKKSEGAAQRLENQVVQTRIQGKVDKADASIDKQVGRVENASELSRSRIQDFQREQTSEQEGDSSELINQIFSTNPIAGES